MSDARWNQVSRIYNDAAALAPSDRAAFLQKACGADDALRAEVDSLLVGDSRAERLLESKDSRMDLIGQRIGVYEIRSLLGAGGMGEVYRARDTKLGRDVAIKVLPTAFTSDRDRLARFEREARLLATLNHPHIGAIYGLEEADGVRALVLELIEGETLRERLIRGALPLTEALAIARQLAEALEAAHDKGIIHRDLKPANIKITPDGMVKVLDFGLAKVANGDGSRRDLSQSPTITLGGTHDGVILGTAAYMSPEQARGKAVDKRSDIWAFGCVLYEVLTGRAVFSGDTVSDTVAAILGQEPDRKLLPASTPAGVQRLLHRCLEKDPKRRLHDIADGRLELDEALIPGPVFAREQLPFWRRALPVVALAAVVGAASAAAAIWQSRPSSRPIVTRFTYHLDDDQVFTGALRNMTALSPDGP